ncbi:IS4 family transposase [Desulfolithobacter dissulfuricans]|uniref:IS4 family transposase n=1 Tax=Desulfolithobacter dissulfuricans TaxID=2795293 RepID=A0A915U129_9BACT|nr:IS4 family transposase [Desulfolithobacter dissulfuricans]BCO08850.1 IS4 family transposase [Desulfolithobacter dissulfuricans]
MAHNNTVLAQLLKLIDRHDFQTLENGQFRPQRTYRALSRWGQFTTMMFAQITGRASLRDISASLQAQAGRLYHLGLKPVKKSTLADANNNRTAEFFQAFFEKTYQRCGAIAPGKKKFRFKNKLYSLDASTIDLCLSVFPWARFRSAKGGIKLHAVLDHDGHIPQFASITDAKTSDLAFARTLALPAGSIVAADRAYIDFAWLYQLNERRNYLVTRLKSNIKYRVVERRSVLKNKGLTSDQTIILTGPKAGDCPIPLRRIGYRDPETGKQYFFLTNNFHLAAKTIADIYKDRWKIELFFKWIKQNLKIKTFLGTSRNAVMTQIWVALITMLVLAYMKFLANLGQSITQIQRLLQLNLFKRQSLWALFERPPAKHKIDNPQKMLFDFS